MTSWLDEARKTQVERRAALTGALLGLPREADPEPEPEKLRPGFDGGARQTPEPPAETHDETLSRMFRTGEANVGGHL
jgi:hypothetical protein